MPSLLSKTKTKNKNASNTTDPPEREDVFPATSRRVVFLVRKKARSSENDNGRSRRGKMLPFFNNVFLNV